MCLYVHLCSNFLYISNYYKNSYFILNKHKPRQRLRELLDTFVHMVGKNNFTGHRSPGWSFFVCLLFSTLNISLHSLLACMVSEKSDKICNCSSIYKIFFPPLWNFSGSFLYLGLTVVWKWYAQVEFLLCFPTPPPNICLA